MVISNILAVENESWLHQQVVEFAEKYGLSTWDWVALIITSLSLIIAIVSVVIATKTLRSQEETQKNTQPVMNIENQEFLIGQKLLCILDSYIYMFALQYFLTKNDYKVKPSSHFWHLTEIALGDLNESLFYNENNKFVAFHRLREVIEEFNTNLLGLKEILSNAKAQKEEKDLEIVHIYSNIGQIMSACYDTLEICFQKDTEQIKTFLETNFISVFETRYYGRYKDKFCSQEEVLILPQIENSESAIKQGELYKKFAEMAFKRIPMITKEEKANFCETLAKHVDVIIMNTPCKGKIMPLKTTKESNSLKYSIDTNWSLTNTDKEKPLYERVLPEYDLYVKPYQYLNGWFFYVTSI